MSEFQPSVWYVRLKSSNKKSQPSSANVHTEAEDTCLIDIITCGTWKIEVLAQPVTLDLCLKATLDHRIARKLA